MEKFIELFAEQFEETAKSVFSSETHFHDLDEWCSLVELAVLNMIAKKYGVKIKPDELKNSKTIGELFSLIQIKQ